MKKTLVILMMCLAVGYFVSQNILKRPVVEISEEQEQNNEIEIKTVTAAIHNQVNPSEYPRPSPKILETNACKKALQPLQLPKEMKGVAAETIEELKAYKALWEGFCKKGINDKNAQGELTIEPLLREVHRLFHNYDVNEKFNEKENYLDKLSFSENLADSDETQRLRKQNRAFSDKWQKLTGSLIKLIPAVTWGPEGMRWMPDYRDFVEISTFSGPKDRLYWEVRSKVFGTRSTTTSWIQLTWDYGGCYRFGEYDWVEALTQLGRLEGKFEGHSYDKEAFLLGEQIIDALSHEEGYCVCKDKKSITEDFEKILKIDGQSPLLDEVKDHIIDLLELIHAGELKIKSDALNECSYG